MEKKNMYPEMPEVPGAGGMPDAPPTYNQSFPTAPSADMPMMMPSPGAGAMMVQPQPHQQQQPFAQPQTIFIQNSPPIPPLGPQPCLVTCPSCHHQAMSEVRLKTAMKTHLFAALLCFLGLVCCACIPYCVDSCKNPNHYCRNCGAYLGRYVNNDNIKWRRGKIVFF